MDTCLISPSLKRFQPVIDGYETGNCGVPYVWRFDAKAPGPVVLINALTHGNEPCGAWALDQLLKQAIRPLRGSLILSFANTAAYRQASPARPEIGRCVDEDLNRVWSPSVLDGDRHSIELDRARALRPMIDQVDILLDLHSMQDLAPPMLLCGQPSKNRNLARQLGFAGVIGTDAGHAAGPRILDYGGFGDPTDRRRALLVECGHHRSDDSGLVALSTTLALLGHLDMIDPQWVPQWVADHRAPVPSLPHCEIEVTHAVTVATDRFRFVEPFSGIAVVADAGTVIGFDDQQPVAAPYDDSILIMPARNPQPGHTAVRIGRCVAGALPI